MFWTPSHPVLTLTLSSRYLSYVQPPMASKVLGIQISDSLIQCLDTKHFVRFNNLRSLKVTNSMMGQVICYNSDVQILANLEHLNFTNNRITQLGQDISALSNLKSLDLSDNLLSEALNPLEFSRLPASLLNLDMTQNVIIISIVN